MSIKAGLVGLPNVGKSTLFNALTKSNVPAENYPFCTIDPHVAITKVPDPRMDDLTKAFGSQKIIPASIQFVDIAGLVKGAAQGEGLGNQFLSHIKEVDLILHVMRCFEGSGDIDPLDHFETIIAELILKDLDALDKRQTKVLHSLKASQNKPVEKKAFEAELELIKQLIPLLNNQEYQKARQVLLASGIATTELLSTKNYLIIANFSENDFMEDAYKENALFQTLQKKFGPDRVIPTCAKTEYELTQLDEAQAQEMMDMLGMKTKGLDLIITRAYQELGLITFFTCGPKEAHAWPILKGITIRKAAGEIHSDLEKGFICAEIFNYNDIVQYKTESALKAAGKVRIEGQDYIVQDGDIVHVRFNV